MARPPQNIDIRSEFSRFLSQATEQGWEEFKVLFGFAWGNYLYEDGWLEEVISLDELDSRVQAAEKSDHGSIGDDDLFITVVATGVEHTFCHENDIHLKGKAHDKYMLTEVTRYQEMGWQVYERRNESGESSAKWHLIAKL